MITRRCWVFLILVLACGVLAGWFLGTSITNWQSARKTTEHPAIEVDELFLQDFSEILRPFLSASDQVIADLTAQNQWLKDNLIKCIEEIEYYRGISFQQQPKKYPTFGFAGMEPYDQYRMPQDINSRRNGDIPELVSEKQELEREIKKQICLMNLRVLNLAMLRYGNEMSITELKPRLANISDCNQP